MDWQTVNGLPWALMILVGICVRNLLEYIDAGAKVITTSLKSFNTRRELFS